MEKTAVLQLFFSIFFEGVFASGTAGCPDAGFWAGSLASGWPVARLTGRVLPNHRLL